MAKRLLKRKSVEAPKPAPARGKEEEPETTLGKEVETAVKPEDKKATLGKCVECQIFNAHSEADKLCYSCHRTKEGFEFDEDKNRWVKKKEKR